MIDIKLIRENPELVRENMKKKFRKDLELVDKLKKLDTDWRKLKYQEDDLRSERNKISEEINKLKKQKKSADSLISKAKKIPEKIAKLGDKRKKMEGEILELQTKIPNIMSKNVPIGKDDSENVEGRVVGKPAKFDFGVKSHVEIAENLGMVDFESSARVAGTGFYYLEGELALLNVALINYARDVMVSKGYRYVETPFMLRNEVIDKVT
ncbi:MAG: serine--tRNA ligase, partial [Nanoarchaeota archaeon]